MNDPSVPKYTPDRALQARVYKDIASLSFAGQPFLKRCGIQRYDPLPDGVPNRRVGHDRLSCSDDGAGPEPDADGLAPLHHYLLDVRLQLDPAAELLDALYLPKGSRLRNASFNFLSSYAEMPLSCNNRK